MHTAYNRLFKLLIDKAIAVRELPGDSISKMCELVRGLSMKERDH